jgi:hypothetical protein
VADFVTHVIVGERVYPHIAARLPGPTTYGSFLLGCVVVDANHYDEGVDRGRTHFVGRLSDVGTAAFRGSCASFLKQRDRLLARPWNRLEPGEQAFIAGYLCHLAVDETWKALGWQLMQKLGVRSPKDFPVPVDVLSTAFAVESSALFLDRPRAARAVARATVPDVLTHVPHALLQRTWQLTRDYALDGSTPAAFIRLLERQGKPKAEVRARHRQHLAYWGQAAALVREVGGVEPHVEEAVARAIGVLPRLWEAETEQ